MTIHYIYVTAGYAFWLYIIVYITARMTSKIWREKHHDKYIKTIESFFSPSEKKKGLLARYHVCLINNDDRMFAYSCECYLKSVKKCTEEQKVIFRYYLTEIVNYKIFKTTKHNRLTRCLIIGCIDRCSLDSRKIRKFLNYCKTTGEAQRQWIQYSKEFNESLIKEEDRWNY